MKISTTLHFILLFVCFQAFTLCSQEDQSIPASIEWGEELKEPAGTVISKIIGTTADGFYTLREKTVSGLAASSAQTIIIEQFSKKMKLKKSRDIKLKYNNKNLDFVDVLMLNNELYLLSSFNNQAKKKNYLFVQKISSRSLQPKKDLLKIGEIDARNKERKGKFDYAVSKDSSKVLIYNELPYKKRDPERFALRVYDQQFEELWSKNISLPYNDEHFAVEEYRIDNQGNVYLLGVIYEDQSRRRRGGKPTYQYVILAYTKDGGDAQEYRVELGDKFITDLTFRIADNGHLVCSGFYSDKGTYSIKGTYFFRLDSQTKQMYNQNSKEFDFDFVTEYLSDKQKQKLKKAERKGNTRRQAELYQYDLDRLILRSDGGALLVAEQYFVKEYIQRDYFYGTFQYDYYYYYNDIIVVNIRPDGEIEWASRIPKRQVTSNDGGYFSSYAMAIVRDRLYFVYNDNDRNFDPSSKRLHRFNGRSSIIALTELRKDGSATTYPLFSNRDANIITRPKICKQIGRKEMAIYGERNRKFKFASLQFD